MGGFLRPAASVPHPRRRASAPATVLLVVLTLVLPPGASASPAASPSAAPVVWAPGGAAWAGEASVQPLLVGVVVNGRELDAVDIYREGDLLWLPVEPLAPMVDAELTELEDGGVALDTPLGRAVVPAADVRGIDRRLTVERAVLEELLASTIRFDEREFALVLTVPWRAGAERPAAPTRPVAAPTPDVRAPRTTLSTIQLDLSATDQDDDRRSTSSAVLGGRIAGGWWRVRHRSDLEGDDEFREYAWLRPVGDGGLLQLGHQLVRLHPLLPSLELTGAQVAWTNRDLSRYRRTSYPGELLPRNATPIRSFRGPAPPGGVAELRVDGIVVDRQVVGLTGTYEFLDVPLDARQATIEVRVFERGNLVTPVDIRVEEVGVSSLLLDDGAFALTAGAGAEGNPADQGTEGGAGLLGYRLGLDDRTTLELGAQHSDDRTVGTAGLVRELTPGLVIAAAAGVTDGGVLGSELELDGRLDRWWLTARSRWREAGYDDDDGVDTWDHRGDLRYRASDALELGLAGRTARTAGDRIEFLAPTVWWRPTRTLSLRGRPSSDGEYQSDLRWTPTRRLELTVSSLDRTFTSLAYRPAAAWRLALEAETGGGRPDVWSAFATWSGAGRWRPSVTAGPRLSGGDLGYRLRASAAVGGGLYAVVQVDDDPALDAYSGGGGVRVFAALSADLALVGGRLAAARTGAVRDDRGGIAGRIVVPDGVGHVDLREVSILLDGYPTARASAGGTFFVGDLPAGIYRVALDAEGLPIELVPTAGPLVVEVAEAAVTRVTLPVRLELGIAGRVVGPAGDPLEGLELEVVADGRVIARGDTDRFGLYRADGIPPGRYEVRLSPGQTFKGSREVVVVDDYLFGQDLVASPTATAAPPEVP